MLFTYASAAEKSMDFNRTRPPDSGDMMGADNWRRRSCCGGTQCTEARQGETCGVCKKEERSGHRIRQPALRGTFIARHSPRLRGGTRDQACRVNRCRMHESSITNTNTRRMHDLKKTGFPSHETPTFVCLFAEIGATASARDMARGRMRQCWLRLHLCTMRAV